ncbi:MAG: hydantoinase/oxoprolinase N-terminal domain-containing protein [Lysobacterales bacterium]
MNAALSDDAVSDFHPIVADFMRIGVDVGGTNTDAVALDGSQILASVKTSTTEDISSGVVDALRQVISNASLAVSDIRSVMIGTTQFTNAFVQARGLDKVGVIRLGAPATRALPPLVAWPLAMKTAVYGDGAILPGGYQVDGSELTSLDEDAVSRTVRGFADQGLENVAISSVFGPLNSEAENRCADIVAQMMPGASITCATDIGRLGLLERESAAVMNASLTTLAAKVVDAFTQALQELKIDAPLYITQNDGTLMQSSAVKKFPVLTFASGPTNSMRGAAFLTGESDAIVVDIGGTTTDVGVLSGGFPRESSINVDIGGVRTNFRMPDIFSMGLGGGSLVTDTAVGPQSVGHAITEHGWVFSGDTLTATDIAVAAGRAEIGDKTRLKNLSAATVKRADDRIQQMLAEAVDRMKTHRGDAVVVLVGGGAVLADKQLPGADRVLVPEQFGVANAVGAAIAQVGGEVDRVVSFDKTPRTEALKQLKAEAIDQAVIAGAHRNSTDIVDIEELPLAYVPGQCVRVRVKAVGDLYLESTP